MFCELPPTAEILKYQSLYKKTTINWAAMRENLSSWFPRMQDSNQPAQLQRPARN